MAHFVFAQIRKLNVVIQADLHLLPWIEDCIDCVGKAKYVTILDLSKGYWQILLTKRAKELSAFVTPKRLYQCLRIRNAPATFQRLINQMVRGLED